MHFMPTLFYKAFFFFLKLSVLYNSSRINASVIKSLVALQSLGEFLKNTVIVNIHFSHESLVLYSSPV